MNIWVLQAALVVLIVVTTFGIPRYRNKARPRSFKGLLVNQAAAIGMFVLVLTETNIRPAGWILLLFVTAMSVGKTILYYRAKTGPLENHEVA